MKDTLSIIIPFYCIPEPLFKRCIRSVLIENSPNIEVLIIDDGSPEEYLDPLKKIDDDRVRILTVPHAGVSAARNKGIEEAKGKWITFIDADDYVNTGTLHRIIDEIDQFHGDVEIFNGGADDNGKIYVNTNYLQEGYNYAEKKEDKIGVMSCALSVGIFPRGYAQYFSYGAPYCKLLNREFLINNDLRFDSSITFAEDVLFMLHVYERADSIYFHDWFLYFYVNNVESVTRKFRPGISDDMDAFFGAVQQFLHENHLEDVLEKAYYTRAQFEARRSYLLEFFHPENNDFKALKKYKQFIAKEPYRTAIKKQYLPRGNYKLRTKYFLIEHGWIKTYRLARGLGRLIRSIKGGK